MKSRARRDSETMALVLQMFIRSSLLLRLLVPVLLSATYAAANDSTAELAMGGLVLAHNDGIEMRSEDLFISKEEVRVGYKFFNTARTDTKVLVAFPMPDIVIEGIDDMISIPTENPENIMDFHTLVDGQPVVARVEQVAMKDGVDRTTFLRDRGIPVQPHIPSTAQVLDRLPEETKTELLNLKLAVPNDYDEGKGWEHHLAPSWTLKTTYYWEQVFPAQREVKIQHRYKPSVGSSAGTSVGSSNGQDAIRRYCIDEQFLASIERTRKQIHTEDAPFTESRIAYILSTGANWRAAIGDFRLVVDKGRPDNLISFCATGVRKIGPTQFEVHKTKYRPEQDLNILILEPRPKS
jgi:Domain of unknown function (DUF4424)